MFLVRSFSIPFLNQKASLEASRDDLGPCGLLLGWSWAILGRSWAVLGRSWAVLERSKIDQKIDPKLDSKTGRIATEKNGPNATPVVVSELDRT